MDYYERALYNHILASQNPETGMMCYFVPLRMGTRKTFSNPYRTFTCCVGSGIENHSKYGEQIYSHDKDNNIYVNLFIPSVLNWKEKQIVLRQETDFPKSNSVNFIYEGSKSKSFTLYIRKPNWARGTVQFFKNGVEMKDELADGSNGYFNVKNKWKKGDKLELRFPMALYSESMPDNPNRIAFLYGPIVLAGQLGKEMPDPVFGTPVLLTDNRNINDWIKPAVDQPLQFEMQKVGNPFDVKLIPFYQTYDQYYSVYWDYFTSADWAARQKEYEDEKKREKEIEEKTIDYFRVGEMQPERDHNLTASERSYVSHALGIAGREARSGNYFSFEMKVDNSVKNNLLLKFIGDDKDRKFDILIDGTRIATEEWTGGQTGKFYEKEYSIPAELIANKSKVTVRIEANYGKTAGRVFGVRTIRS